MYTGVRLFKAQNKLEIYLGGRTFTREYDKEFVETLSAPNEDGIGAPRFDVAWNPIGVPQFLLGINMPTDVKDFNIVICGDTDVLFVFAGVLGGDNAYVDEPLVQRVAAEEKFVVTCWSVPEGWNTLTQANPEV